MRTAPQEINEEQRRLMIADAAHFRAERRGFNGGDPLNDWLEAEIELDAQLHKTRGEDLLEELDQRLAIANGKLRALKKKLSGMKADVREEWMHDVEKLAKLRDRFQKRLEEMRAQGEHASEKAKAQANKIWYEISDVVERVSSRKSTHNRGGRIQ